MTQLFHQLFHQLFRLSSGCYKVPLVAAVGLVVCARFSATLAPPSSVREPVVLEQLSSDAALIDSVLARRAPELGLTLRRQLAAVITEEARRASYDPLLVLAVMDVESDFDEGAVSYAGARGLMQIMPATLYWFARKQGLRLSPEELERDPTINVRLGVRYLREMHDKFGDLDLALMAYNTGPGRVKQAQKNRTLDQLHARVYPGWVRRDYLRFRRGLGLDGDWALALRQ